MPKIAKEVAALTVQRGGPNGEFKKPGFFMVGVVPGLGLQVTDSGARSWVLRVTVGTKRRDMGLGGYPAFSLAQAREMARAARESAKAGQDPVLERQRSVSALKAEQASALTFAQCTAEYIKANRSAWKSAKHAQQWETSLERWAYSKLGHLLVRDVGLPQVLAVLNQPADDDDAPSFWNGKTETASRVRGRIEAILDWAAVRGMREKDNPARWKGHLDKLLPAPNKIRNVEHHRAVPVGGIAEFMQSLRAADGLAARALEFAILTAARSGEVRGARWSEIDLAESVWTIPAERMKGKREHRVPLSADALTLLTVLPRLEGVDLVFPAPRSTTGDPRELSDMTLTAVMRRLGTDAVPHGFRSTFRDWVAERTAYPGDLAEKALAHVVTNKVEAAYQRGDMFDKRRRMMEDWARFTKARTRGGKNIVGIGRKVA